MAQKIGIIILAFLFGIIIGYIAFTPAASAPEMTDAMDMSAGVHNHPMLEVDTTLPIPTLEIETFKDSKDGYNVHILTTNYTFTPELVNTDPVQGEGHAHIYANGVKVARVYGEWFNVPGSYFKEGENLIEVTLNANDHSEWMIDGQHIIATAVVEY